MAKLPYSWNKVSSGDIISFIYENREGRKVKKNYISIRTSISKQS